MTGSARVADELFVSVVVPCLNEEQHLGSLLDALLQQQRPPDEVIVVDGGSTDGSVDLIRLRQAASPALRLRLVERPKGSIPVSVNAGIEAARGAVIVRLDAHSLPSPNYIADAVARLRDRDVGVVGGLWDVAPGAESVVARAIATAVSHRLGAGDAIYRSGSAPAAPIAVDTVPFGSFGVDLWRELGGFDETLQANEDYDFNYRVRKIGRTVLLDPRMRSTYFARATLGDLAKQYFRYGWWKVQMLRKHPRSLRWRQAIPAAFFPLIAMLALAGIFIPSASFALGLLLAVYGAIVAATAAALCLRQAAWALFVPLCAAFATVHVCWGVGFALNVVTGARVPYTVRGVGSGNCRAA